MQNSHLRKYGGEQRNAGDKVFHVSRIRIKRGKGNKTAHCGINLSQSEREKKFEKTHHVHHLYDFEFADVVHNNRI